MMDRKTQTKLSRFLAKVLRHQPQLIGLQLESEGWCSMADLLAKINRRGWGFPVTGEHLEKLVREDTKGRYTILEGKIRANQGHSVSVVDISFPQIAPPEYLYHGTAHHLEQVIRQEGLKAMQRHHVHLSVDEETARKVGLRWDKNPLILKIAAGQAAKDGHLFYISDNGVYLAENIPPQYIMS